MTKEMVNIVDENDIVIGKKARDAITPKDIIRVSVLWIEDGKGNVLMQQRSLNKRVGPGQWGPAVAGTVEAHETYLSNIIKEANEEIGLSDFTPIIAGKKLYWEADGPHGRLFTFFKTTLNKEISDFKIKEDEVAQISWVNKMQLINDVAVNPSKYVPSSIFWKQMYY